MTTKQMELFSTNPFFRLLKKVQMREVEERIMRRTFLYAAFNFTTMTTRQMELFEVPNGLPLGTSKPKEVSIFYSLA